MDKYFSDYDIMGSPNDKERFCIWRRNNVEEKKAAYGKGRTLVATAQYYKEAKVLVKALNDAIPNEAVLVRKLRPY